MISRVPHAFASLVVFVAACAAPAPTPSAPPPPAPPPPVQPATAEPAASAVPVAVPTAAPALVAEPEKVEAPEPPEPGPERPAAPYLVAAVAKVFPRRALLAKGGPVRLSLNGPPAGHPPSPSAPLEVIVVEEHPRSLRVVVPDRNVRLALYVRRDAFQRVAAAATWLSPVAGRPADPTAGVHVAPGVVLEEKERQGGLRKVAGDVDGVHFEGWCPEEAVSPIFVPGRFPGHDGNALVKDGTAITAPGGEVLARLVFPYTPGSGHEVTLLPGGPAGMRAIHVRELSIEVRGLVPAAAVTSKVQEYGLIGLLGRGEGGGARSDTEEALLRAGAGIYTPGGDRVGEAIRATKVWVSYGARASKDPMVGAGILLSDLGFVDAQVKPGDLGPIKKP